MDADGGGTAQEDDRVMVAYGGQDSGASVFSHSFDTDKFNLSFIYYSGLDHNLDLVDHKFCSLKLPALKCCEGIVPVNNASFGSSRNSACIDYSPIELFFNVNIHEFDFNVNDSLVAFKS
jgi:hypothetical protein